MTCSRIILQTRSVTGGDFSCKRQLETPLRCKWQENIASCDMALSLPQSQHLLMTGTGAAGGAACAPPPKSMPIKSPMRDSPPAGGCEGITVACWLTGGLAGPSVCALGVGSARAGNVNLRALVRPSTNALGGLW